jgi:hypothetical protein
MKTKRLIITAALLLRCTLYAGAYDFTVNGLYYNFISNTDNVTVTSPEYPDIYEGAITIPATVSWEGKVYQVTEIGFATAKLTAIYADDNHPVFSSSGGVLFNKDKTRLIAYPVGKTETAYAIPTSVEIIGKEAFLNCRHLISVNIPDGLKAIDYGAFKYCENLSSIIISNSVTSIGSHAFYYCENLSSIVIPNSVTSIESYAFSGCSKLASVTLPDSIKEIEQSAFSYCRELASISIPNSVKSINYYAFHGCKSLETVNLPDSLQTIGDGAFRNCRITSVKLPNAVTSISGSAFSNNPLTAIGIDQNHPNYTAEDGILYNKDKTSLILYPSGKPATTFVIPHTVKAIGNYVFDGNTTLTSIVLPEGLETIGQYAFLGTKIESIVLPNTLKKIGYAAFEGSYIKSITIPASVESIDSWAFTKCPYLESIVFEGPVQYIGGVVFAGYANSPRSYTIEVKCEPFKIDNSLGYVDVEKSTLIVPDGMRGLFLATPGWKDFGTIIEKSGVSNEAPATETRPVACISRGVLHIETPRSETVHIYSITGRLLARFTKPTGSMSYPASSFGERLLIVKGSSGWTVKVIVK